MNFGNVSIFHTATRMMFLKYKSDHDSDVQSLQDKLRPRSTSHKRIQELALPSPSAASCSPSSLQYFVLPVFAEYETQSSAEAKFVKQLDQCEMILQASEYEDLENKPGRLQDFYDGTADVNLFIFNSLDSIKKRDTIWTIKEATVPDVVLKCVDEDLGIFRPWL
ncbi:5'-deoxynucleotidase HDDC2 isoform X4 [Rhinolophus sinicus]|uniref:5'-deoxynucleotidase HDDC2 isoform X4 n=1 Tax=Rhinolophus sinicus TaxID=89399 RepID=UPI003D7B7B21